MTKLPINLISQDNFKLNIDKFDFDAKTDRTNIEVNLQFIMPFSNELISDIVNLEDFLRWNIISEIHNITDDLKNFKIWKNTMLSGFQ